MSHFKTFKYHWFKKTGYRPHESQRAVHDSKKRFVVCVSGRRFGKSMLAAKEAQAILMHPNKRVWIVAPTYSLSEKVFREIYHDLIIKKCVSRKSIVKKSESERLIRLAWGSEVIAKSADNPDSLLGEAVDLIIFDECAKVDKIIWEKYLRPTLTDRNGRALFITTPEGTNWVYRLFLRGSPKNDKNDLNNLHEDKDPPVKDLRDWESFLFPTDKNPHISANDITEAKRSLPAQVFNQEYMAEFYTFSGKIYQDFVLSTHIF